MYSCQLHRIIPDWLLGKACNGLRLTNTSLLSAANPEAVLPPPPRFTLELQMLFISACMYTHGKLKNLRLVCKAWNDEILFKHSFFNSLLFKDKPDQAHMCRHREYWLCSSIRSLGIADTITSIMLYRWMMDSHCWFLHVLNHVTNVKIISSGSWPWLYCLPGSVERLLIRDTEIRVCPGLYRLCDDYSQLSCLILDSVTVPFIVCGRVVRMCILCSHFCRPVPMTGILGSGRLGKQTMVCMHRLFPLSPSTRVFLLNSRYTMTSPITTQALTILSMALLGP